MLVLLGGLFILLVVTPLVVLYGKFGVSISSATYSYAEKGNDRAIKFRNFINYLFNDDNHCRNAYIWEKTTQERRCNERM